MSLWYVRVESSAGWKTISKPKYPFHSAVAKQYADELPLGDHVVVVTDESPGQPECVPRRFLVSNITTTYVRPLE